MDTMSILPIKRACLQHYSCNCSPLSWSDWACPATVLLKTDLTALTAEIHSVVRALHKNLYFNGQVEVVYCETRNIGWQCQKMD